MNLIVLKIGAIFGNAQFKHYFCGSKKTLISYFEIMQDWREKLGAAFNMEVPSDEDIKQAQNPVEEPAGDALAQQGKQMVNVLLDKKGRNGKKVTLVTDLLCDDEALKELAAELKRQCGVGGSARGGEILIQGDFREKIVELLKKKGFKARVI